MMKAIVCHQYGAPENLRLEELPKPVPRDSEVLVRIHAAGVNAGDWHVLRGEPFLVRLFMGMRKPKFPVLGSDMAGVVEAVGKSVTQFQPGDTVFGDLSASGFGAFAEYVCAPERALVPMPGTLSFPEAAVVPISSMTALQALRFKGDIKPGDHVAINGASGGVGTYAVQIAKALGAEVTAICSTRNIEHVRNMGADHVVDYTKEDFTESAERYDVIHAVNGYHPMRDYKRALKPGGKYVMSGGTNAQLMEAMLLAPWMSMAGDKKMGQIYQKQNQSDLAFVSRLIEEGKVRPVLDTQYSLEEAPDAIRYVEEGRAQGKVVITMETES